MYPPVLRIKHPSLDTLYPADLQRVVHTAQLTQHGYVLEAGERGTMWYVGVLPESVTRDEVEVGFDNSAHLEGDIAIRWIPE